MKIAVTYKSKTEFTKRYAEMIAREANCPLIDFKEMTAKKMSDFDIIVYGGGLYAGMVNGLAKAKGMYLESSAKKLIVFATGGTPNAAKEMIDEVWKNNLTTEEIESIPHYYMQSGICYEKMALPSKALMKMAAHMLKNKQNKEGFEEGFAQAIQGSYDISSIEYARPLIYYLLSDNCL